MPTKTKSKKNTKTNKGFTQKLKSLATGKLNPFLAVIIVLSVVGLGYYGYLRSSADTLNLASPPKVTCANSLTTQECKQKQLASDIRYYERTCSDLNRIAHNDGCGNCKSGYYEKNNVCKQREAVNCSAQNRIQSDPYSCGGCKSGYYDKDGVCKQRQEVDCSLQHRVQTDLYNCGACKSGYTAVNGDCVTSPPTSAAALCAAAHKNYDATTNSCTTCLSGYIMTSTGCQSQLPTVDCSAQNRVQTGKATCGTCVSGYTEVNSVCVKSDHTAEAKVCAAAHKNYDPATNKCTTCLTGYVMADTKCQLDPSAPQPAIDAVTCNLLGRIPGNQNVVTNVNGRSTTIPRVVCQEKCQTDAGNLVPGKTTSYCTKAVATGIDQSNCNNRLHRVYLSEGCARRPDQKDTDNAPQCLPGYPFYNADFRSTTNSTLTDTCATDRLTAAQNEADGTISGAPVTNVPASSIATDEASCALIGRTWGLAKDTTGRPTADRKPTCTDVCQPGTGELVAGKTIKYCKETLSVDVNQDACVRKLHRFWVAEGCARRADRKDTNNAPQCLGGFPYYNANVANVQKNTNFDVCENNEAVATANEAAGTPGAADPNSAVTHPGDGDSAAPGSGECGSETNGGRPYGDGTCSTDNIIRHPAATAKTVPEVTVVDHYIDKPTCAMLGRVWVDDSTVNGETIMGGCSVQECVRTNANARAANGSAYCEGSVDRITQEACLAAHRTWIPQVDACAAVATAKAGTHVNATQCQAPYTVYVARSSKDGGDECVKPSTFQRLQGIAKTTGKPVAAVAAMNAKALCEIQTNKMWNGTTCVKKAVAAKDDSVSQTATDSFGQSYVRSDVKHVSKSCGQFYKDVTASQQAKFTCVKSDQACELVNGSPRIAYALSPNKEQLWSANVCWKTS